MIQIDTSLKIENLKKKLDFFWELSGEKINAIDKNYDASKGSPVFTVNGKYSTRGWTEWTQGFQFGSSILQFDATSENYFLESGRKSTLEKMAPHISHIGVHDHGFNNLSTYGNLLRGSSGQSLDKNQGWWFYLFFQRSTFVVRRHYPFVPYFNG